MGGEELPGFDNLEMVDQLIHLMNGGLKRNEGRRSEYGPSHLVMVSGGGEGGGVMVSLVM